MTRSIQEESPVGNQGALKCPGCDRFCHARYIPNGHTMTVQEKREYRGPKVCANCAPRFGQLPTTDLGEVVL